MTKHPFDVKSWHGPKFAYLEFVKASAPFLISDFNDHLGPKVIPFFPSRQEAFVDMVTGRSWSLIWGRFSAAQQAARQQFENCLRFTVIQDPVDRFAAAYEDARAEKSHPQHSLFTGFSIAEAARWTRDNKTDYGRNSQCSGLLIGQGAKTADAAHALAFCEKSFAFTGTTEQLPALLKFLQTHNLIAPNVTALAPAKTPALSARTRAALHAILSDVTDEDRKLFEHLSQHGPLVTEVPAATDLAQQADDGRKRCLVHGFSVTGDTPGYVEFWQDRYAALHPDIRMDKSAIGGLQPFFTRHLLRDILDRWTPEILILELSTAVYRLRPDTPQQRDSYRLTLENIFLLCKERGIRCGILDLPQTGAKPENDWLFRLNAEASEQYGVPRVALELSDDALASRGLLRDNVHPSDAGRALYAKSLEDVLTQILAQPAPQFDGLALPQRADSYSVADIQVDGGVPHMFSRNGFLTEMIQIRQNEPVTFKLPQTRRVKGLVVSMGPTTSKLLVTINGNTEEVPCFDMHCYYFRVGGRIINAAHTDTITIEQSSDLPSEKLAKGKDNTGARVGGITHILYDTDT
jgi:hypothetical protein